MWELEDKEEAMFIENMEEAEQMEEDEVEEEEKKRDDMDLVHSDFPMEGLRVKLYTIEEESSENEEDEEKEKEDEWIGLKRLQGLSELQRYFLLLAGQQELSQPL